MKHISSRVPAHILLLLLLQLLIMGCPTLAADNPQHSRPQWTNWSEDIFKKATAEKKLVLLDLHANWCHWCHVMEKQTYADSAVQKLLAKHFISVQVDQAQRPDIANRYRDWGWPATIIFNSKGEELVKRAGYIEKDKMTSLLKQLVKNPNVPPDKNSGPSFNKSSQLDQGVREELLYRFYNTHDFKIGGLTIAQRFIDPDSVEYALMRANREKEASMARQTLTSNINLLDHEWGGIYQYSTHYDWRHPHYEKLMRTQANNLRLYSMAYTILEDDEYLHTAEKIAGYLEKFLLSPSGAFYASQDADFIQGVKASTYFALKDIDRRKQGIPMIDKNIFARENGQAITALLALYSATLKEKYLTLSTGAAKIIIAKHSLPGGGFRHAESNNSGPHLADNIFMLRALLDLYTATGERSWLKLAMAVVPFLDKNFRDISKQDNPGYFTVETSKKRALAPVRKISENIFIARTCNLLFHYSGNDKSRACAEYAMRFLAAEQIALDSITEPGILIAEEELAAAPLHITVVGSKGDKTAKELYKESLRYPSYYKRLDWWDKNEGPMINQDINYPALTRAAAFVCTEKTCSLPIFKKENIAPKVARILKRQKEQE